MNLKTLENYHEEIYIDQFDAKEAAELLTYGNIFQVFNPQLKEEGILQSSYLIIDPRNLINRDQLIYNVLKGNHRTSIDALVLQEESEGYILNNKLSPQIKSKVPGLFITGEEKVLILNKPSPLHSLLTEFFVNTDTPLLGLFSLALSQPDDCLTFFKNTSIDVLVTENKLIKKEHYKCY
jgi:hypothetical protein